MTWVATSPKAFLPTEVSESVSKTADLIGQYLDTVRRGLAIAQAYQASLGADATDPFSAVVNALSDTVEGLLQAGRIHVLFIPIAKAAPSAPSSLPPTLADVGTALGFSLEEAGLALSRAAHDGYARLVSTAGGNAGFFQAFAQSLTDVLDPNRPQYDNPEDAVVMTVLMAGAPTFAAAVEVAAALGRLFRPPMSSDFASRTIPTPQNLRAKVIAVPKASGMGVRLEWDAPTERLALPFFPGVDLRITRYAVIRSTSAAAQNARSVTDLFATRDLRVGTTSGDKAQTSEVIAIGSGENTSHVDDAPLDASKTYYYSVAWELEVAENGKTTRLAFDRVSSVVKVRAATPGATATGVPPDWAAYGSLLELAPDLAVQTKTVLEQLRLVGDRRRGASARVAHALELANAQLAATLERVDALNASAHRFAAALAQPLPSLHATTIEGVGGNALLVAELAARLGDTADPARPPFDGNEHVMGLCIVAGGPRLANLKPTSDLLKALFQSPTQSRPLLEVLDVIEGVVAQQEAVLGVDLQPLPSGESGMVTLPNGIVVGAQSIDPLTGQPLVAFQPVIDEQGAPVPGLDPSNPNAGDRGALDDHELC